MTSKKILTAAQHFGAANAVAPVIKELQKQNKDVSILAYKQAETKYSEPQWNFDYKTIENYGFKNETENLTKENMEKILEKENPNFIFTGSCTERDYNGIEKSLIMAGKEMGIPNAMLVDFYPESELRFKDYKTGNLIIPDKVFVIDEYHKKTIIEEGIPEKNVYITGNPAFDIFAEKTKSISDKQKKEIIEKFGGIGTEFVLGYIGNAFEIHSKQEKRGYWDLSNMQFLNETLKKNKNLTILATVHGRMPEEEVEEIKNYLAKFGNQRFKFLEQGDNFAQGDLIYVSDIISTPFSTDAVNAAIAGKPVLSMQGRDIERLATNDVGVTYRLKNYNELGEIIENILLDKQYVNQICPNLNSFKPDGKSVKRILKELE